MTERRWLRSVGNGRLTEDVRRLLEAPSSLFRPQSLVVVRKRKKRVVVLSGELVPWRGPPSRIYVSLDERYPLGAGPEVCGRAVDASVEIVP